MWLIKLFKALRRKTAELQFIWPNYDFLAGAFPESMRKDVLFVALELQFSEDRKADLNYSYRHPSNQEIKKTYSLSSGTVTLPYRCYFELIPEDWFIDRFTELHIKIYACISLLHPDGYFREKQLRYLLTQPLEEWMLPFLFKVSEEYVKEILDVLYEARRDKDNTMLRKFCKMNPDDAQRGYSRMANYWGMYYAWVTLFQASIRNDENTNILLLRNT